jgi:uncharacterized protein (TIGR04255 family)
MDRNIDNLKPPLRQVVVSLSLTQPLAMGLGLLGAIRQRLLTNTLFDEVDDLYGEVFAPGYLPQQRPVAVPGVASGARFRSSDSKLEAALQSDVIAVRWVFESASEYPGHHTIIEHMMMIVDSIAEVRDDQIDIHVAHLLYEKVLECEKKDSWSKFLTYYSLRDALESFPGATSLNELNLAWADERGIDHRLAVRYDTFNSSQASQGVVIRESAGMRGSSAPNPSEMLLEVHSALRKRLDHALTQVAFAEWK